MKSKMFKKLMCVVLALSVCFSFLSLSANAIDDDFIFTVDMAEPTCNQYQGYINLLLKSNSGTYYTRTIFWSCFPNGLQDSNSTDSTVATEVFVQIRSNENKLVLIPFAGNDVDATFSYGSYIALGDIPSFSYKTRTANGGENNTITYNFDSAAIISYQVYGNATITYYDINPQKTFTVLFDDESVQYQKVTELIGYIVSLCSDNQVIISRLNDIMASAQNMEMLLTDVFNLLINIDYYVYDSNQVLYEVLDRLERLLQEMNIDVPDDLDNNLNNNPFDENANNFNPEQSFDDLPDFEFGNGLQSGFGVFRSIFDNIMYAFPGLLNVLTIILILGFVGYVLGRKLNKGG